MILVKTAAIRDGNTVLSTTAMVVVKGSTTDIATLVPTLPSADNSGGIPVGTNFQLAEIKKIADETVKAYKQYAEQQSLTPIQLPEFPEDERDHAIRNVLQTLHLKALMDDKTVKGD